ncbi:MAG: N-6 DNA methylase [Conexivisphaerales archaeon]
MRIAVWDSTELEPGQTIPAISRELKAAYKRPTLELFFEGKPPKEEAYVEKGAVTLEGIGGEQIPLEKADVIIMNPPFTRHQRIPAAYKEVLARRFSKEASYIRGQMGYYGYFIILANRFLKDGGRLALVLPASVLNADGLLKVREFLTTNYHIEHIITTWQRAAFSENAQFREVLLIARKEASKPKDVCVVAELKVLPHDLSEAKKIAEKIIQVSNVRKHGIVYDDIDMQVSLFAMNEIKNSVNNLFRFLAFSDKKLIDVWQSIIGRCGKKLTNFAKYLQSGPLEGIALGQLLKGGGVGYFYIHRTLERMLKKEDVWLLKRIHEDGIDAEHKLLHISVRIPWNAIRCALRRFSGFNTFDISTKMDYIIVNDFPEAKIFFESIGKKVDPNTLGRWNAYTNKHTGNLFLVNHADISASGTSILSYYSSELALVPRSMWTMRVSDTFAKIFALWLNSSLNILQLLLLRRETRGAYLWFVASDIRKFLVPDVDKMLEDEISNLLQTFYKYSNVQFPCVLEQLRGRFWARVEIDKAILKVLGFNETETNQLLDYLYPALAKEIEQLKTLMQG